ncbi:MAG: putative bifunctional diguanylate cyclase/phosphodiesterase, partial [Acidimicrobiales bacterium]
RSESPTELLRDADIALYQAKRRGRGQVAQFEPGMRDAVRDRVALDRELHDALTGGQFFLVYQPTFELGTLEVTGVEALLRWDHPDRGIVPPDEFIPALETSGLIVEVGRFVLDEACRQASRWHAGGLAISIAVNVSARQLEAGSLVADVGSALERSALDPHVLVLEVTESALMADVTRNAARLDRLKSLGIRVAVDDFGTGYSSLAYLQKFPVDILKIDRSFVNALGDSAQSAALVHAMVQLGDALGLETLAEGIEDEAQLQALRGEACRSGQGFWFSRPLRADDAEAFLRSRPLADMFVPTRAGRPPAAR